MEPRKPNGTSALLLVVALALSIVLVGLGIYRATAERQWDILAVGCLGVILTIALSAVAHVTTPKVENTSHVEAKLDALNDRLRLATDLLARISDQQLLSDRAKSVAFRDKDREAIRRAIQEDINRGDWDAALRLADEIEGAFGYKAEAARFRDEVRARRNEQVRRQVQEVVDNIDRLCRTEQWSGALREADRLAAQFPDHDVVRNLPTDIDRRRQEHKRRLLEGWQEAVNRHDVDGSIDILKQLDAYLTPAEAAGMEDAVRGVFKEKRDQLGKTFADAVRDHKWVDAIRVGETIAREFPESRMAQEVKEKMPALRQRAAEAGTPV
ncbi:MAG TPA: hypothetical protein VF796_12010, partial [Humisphaera sp.]